MRVINFIEGQWHRTQSFPPKEKFATLFPDFDLNKALNHPTFRTALDNRGIKHSWNAADDAGLTTEQQAAILTLSNFEDKRSRTKKLADLGISPTKWNGWLKNKAFREFLQEQFAFNFDGAKYIAKESLVKAMERQDVNAIKFYMEVTGEYSQQTPQIHNVRLILARVIESIQRHVSDPEILRAISQDFEVIMRGDQPSQPIMIGEAI